MFSPCCIKHTFSFLIPSHVLRRGTFTNANQFSEGTANCLHGFYSFITFEEKKKVAWVENERRHERVVIKMPFGAKRRKWYDKIWPNW